MCHHYRIIEEEALGEAVEEAEEELDPPEAEPTREEEERERPILTADD